MLRVEKHKKKKKKKTSEMLASVDHFVVIVVPRKEVKNMFNYHFDGNAKLPRLIYNNVQALVVALKFLNRSTSGYL